MANPRHLDILQQGAETWNQWRKENPHVRPDLSRVDFHEPNLNLPNLTRVDFTMANLKYADLGGWNLCGVNLSNTWLCLANLAHARLQRAVLEWADLMNANLNRTQLQQADLTDANLQFSCLVQANLTGAALTGAKLYAAARDDWVIRDVKCEYVYWDFNKHHRCPKDRDLEPGEFEQLYEILPTIEYVFEEGMTPIDPLIMDRVVEAIRDRRPEFDVKIDSINARGVAPSIRLTVRHEEHKKPALTEVRKGYEKRIRELKTDRDRYYALVARALDTPKESRLTIIEAGAVAAIDGSVINIQQHIHNALEVQKAIADAPNKGKSFGRVAKEKALNVIGGAMEDIAKGQVEKAAKEIVKLGKDLGPIILQTAAYAFFKSLIM